jgi:hypothetical protein
MNSYLAISSPFWRNKNKSNSGSMITSPSLRHFGEILCSNTLSITQNEGVKEELTQLHHQIAKHPGKRANELNEQIYKSIAPIKRYLKILKEHGCIEFRGAPKTGGYYLLKK